ncbi:MAG: ribulose-phosphate 3-epimerase [Treponema sp.]|nr:ribulose-phosphate 3-epimerase [Treponema sp.]
MKKVVLAPSLLSADFFDLSSALKKIESSPAGIVHIDVMDGQFVPQISYGQPVVKSLRPHTALPFDVHLMVEKPESMVDSFAQAGADMITFHLESTVHADRLAHHIKDLGKKAGVSIVPSTPVSLLSELLGVVDLVLVMTVNPGFGGQKLIPSCLEKVRELSRIRSGRGLDFLISVDGGVNNGTVSSVVDSGADIVVSGSAFFSGDFEWKDCGGERKYSLYLFSACSRSFLLARRMRSR